VFVVVIMFSTGWSG